MDTYIFYLYDRKGNSAKFGYEAETREEAYNKLCADITARNYFIPPFNQI